MTDRKPLVPLSEEARRKLQQERGLSEDNTPLRLSLTDAEKLAASQPGLPAPPKEQPMKVPAWLVAVAGVLTTGLYLVHTLLPPPWGLVAYGLAFVSAFLAGVGIQAPKFVTGKPLVPLTVVPIIASLVPLLVSFAGSLQPGVVKSALELLAIVAVTLAGLPLDTARPKEVAPPAVIVPPAP